MLWIIVILALIAGYITLTVQILSDDRKYRRQMRRTYWLG